MTPESPVFVKVDLTFSFLVDAEALTIYELFGGKRAVFKTPRRIAGKSKCIV